MMCMKMSLLINLKTMISSIAELGRKSLSSALLNFWIYKELQERKEANKHFFGPYYSEDEVDGYIAFKRQLNNTYLM